MAPRGSTPPEVVRQALDAYKKHGSIRKAADETGIPKSTLHEWVSTVQEDEQDDPHDAPDPNAESVEEADGTDPGDGIMPDTAEEELEEQPVPTPHRSELDAMVRYVNLVANGVHPAHATDAATQIDPGFHISDENYRRIADSLENRGMNPRGYNFGEPPAYVQAMADDYGMDELDEGQLADILYGLKLNQWTTGLNDQLVKIGRPRIDAITDQAILSRIRSDSDSAAKGIADTYNRDVAGRVATLWAEQQTNDGNGLTGSYLAQAREDAMMSDLGSWLDDRNDWKAAQITSTEANSSYNDAAQEFNSQNGTADQARVTPDGCVCDGCQELVDLGWMPASDAENLDLPLHPGCVHELEYDHGSVADDQPLWVAQDEPQTGVPPAVPDTPDVAATA